MADFESTEERTEPASQKKRDEARQKGSVARSVELNSAAVLVFGLLILYVGGSSIASNLAEVARSAFINLGTVELNTVNVADAIQQGVFRFSITVVPVLVGLMLIGVVASVSQVGVMFTLKPMVPSWGKINPMKGLKRIMFSTRAVVELIKGLLKVGIVGFVAYSATSNVITDSVELSDGDIAGILVFMAKASAIVGFKVGLAFFVIAIGDYVFQRFDFEKSLRMTKQEVKDESKQNEGDPLIKGRIRTIQRQIAYRRMMQDVPKADVVVTNPTHFAVAIKYELGKMNAPKVVAKGADLVALRIKEIAKEHRVPVVEDKPLAQMLYKTVEVGDEIPEKLFQAVAQVLAYVYKLRDARRPRFSMN